MHFPPDKGKNETCQFYVYGPFYVYQLAIQILKTIRFYVYAFYVYRDSNLYKKNRINFSNYYKIYIRQISYLLNELGININTVPVLDVRKSGSSNIIGDRSYSSIPNNVFNIGDFCIAKFNREKIDVFSLSKYSFIIKLLQILQYY